jgi:hypothetical protein
MVADALVQPHAAHTVVGRREDPIHHQLQEASTVQDGIEARRVPRRNVVDPLRRQTAEDFLAAWCVEITAQNERAVLEQLQKPVAGAALELSGACIVRPGEMRRADGEAVAAHGEADEADRIAVGAQARLFASAVEDIQSAAPTGVADVCGRGECVARQDGDAERVWAVGVGQPTHGYEEAMWVAQLLAEGGDVLRNDLL